MKGGDNLGCARCRGRHDFEGEHYYNWFRSGMGKARSAEHNRALGHSNRTGEGESNGTGYVSASLGWQRRKRVGADGKLAAAGMPGLEASGKG